MPDEVPEDGNLPLTYMEKTGMTMIADGPDEVLKRVHLLLRADFVPENRHQDAGGKLSRGPVVGGAPRIGTGQGRPRSDGSSGHFFECARLAGKRALGGEHGALALYNPATGLLVERLAENQTRPWQRAITLGGGAALRGQLEPGAPSAERRYVNVDSLKFVGVYASILATRPGVGAPLVAIAPENPDFRKTYETSDFQKGLTTVLRFDSGKSATLEPHDQLEVEKISIAGRNPPLAADFSVPVSMQMCIHRPDRLGLVRLLDPQKYSDTAPSRCRHAFP